MQLLQRPRLLTGAVFVTASALLLVGCSGGGVEADKSNLTTPAVAGEIAQGALDGSSLTFVGYGGDIQRGQMQAYEPFTEVSGAELISDEPTDYAKLAAQVKSGVGQWDVVTANGHWAVGHCDDLLAPIDDDLVDRSVLNPDHQGTKCSVPILGTGYVLSYNTEKYSTAPATWADFFDTKKFPGKRGIYSGDPMGIYEIALLADGVAPADLYPLDTERALAKLDTIRDDIVWWAEGAQSQQLMESGEVDLGYFWSGRVLKVVQNDGTWDTAKDKALVYWDHLVIPKSSENQVAANAFINWALGNDPQEVVVQTTGYPGSNITGEPDIDATVANFQVTQAPYTDTITIDEIWWAENLNTETDRWTNWVNG